VFSNRRLRRAVQDCARDGTGAEQQSASANAELQIAISPFTFKCAEDVVQRRSLNSTRKTVE
jgi:hypothetical protein